MERQFDRYIGVESVNTLREMVTPNLVITVGGDQLTGKSTVSGRLAKHFNGEAMAAGSIFRAEAKRRGIPVAELSRVALDNPAIDVGIEYKLAELIATGISSAVGPLFIEGRQAGVMATYARTRLNKTNCIRLYLGCTIREQGLRFLEREVSVDVFREASTRLGPGPYQSLQHVADAIAILQLKGLTRDNLAKFVANQHRDDDDRRRYNELYAFGDTLDYRNTSLYDIVIDTTPNQPADTFAQALAGLQRFGIVSSTPPPSSPRPSPTF